MKVTKEQLLEAYKLYPRKRGKTPGLKIMEKNIRTLIDLQNLKIAIENYRQELIENETEPRYIMHFSTFMGQWEDFLDQDSSGELKRKTVLELLKEG